MSAGNPIVKFRLPKEHMVVIEDLIRKSITTRREGPHSLSSWIREACLQKLDHIRRSKKKSRKG